MHRPYPSDCRNSQPPRDHARVLESVPRMLRSTRCCAADPGPHTGSPPMDPGSAAQREGRCTASGTPGVLIQLAADVAADDIAEQLPPLALEALQLKLADRGEDGRRGVDLDAGQQDFGAEILEACGLLHDVFAGEVVAALLQHLNQGLRDAIADDDRA